MRRAFPDFPSTVPEALDRAAEQFSDRGVSIFGPRGRTLSRRSWTEIRDAARRAAGCWAAAEVQPGDRLIVVLGSSWEWFDAWFGAVLLGALPVAVAPGAVLGPGESQLRKVEGVLERLGARFVVANSLFRRSAAKSAFMRTAAHTVTPDEIFGLAPAALSTPAPTADDLAFLQLTSGSTGIPRAAEIRHRNLMSNVRAIDDAIGAPAGGPIHTWADSLVSWLPLHHDMGLVGCVLLSMVTGLDLWLLQPATFLARPRLWLEQIGAHGTTIAHAPNFGYQECVDQLRPDDVEDIDLSGWRYAMSGAEMIRPETIRNFCQKFGPLGFSNHAFRPCYGLAEATLCVTIDQTGQGVRSHQLPSDLHDAGHWLDPDMTDVACVGWPVNHTMVRIAGPDGRDLDECQIGEVAVRGPGVFAGYWNDPVATAEALVDGELRTGDLGFLHRGELYVTGRTKDLLIVRGNNLMPHEIEWLAEKVTGGGGALRSGAFSVSQGNRGEAAVVVVETHVRDPERLEELQRAIRVEVSKGLSLLLSDIVFVPRGRIPQTSSGKVRRRVLREQYLDGRLRTP